MPRIIGAGLQCLTAEESVLVIVRQQWAYFRLLAIHRGSLLDLAHHASELPVAMAIQDDSLSHWLEEFPRHLSPASIAHYLQHHKAELLTSTDQHLTMAVHRLGQTQQVHCWLLSRTIFRQEYQAYLAAGFRIRAIEPLSYLNDRPEPPYRDPQRLLDHLTPVAQAVAKQSLKLACRRNWATEDWLC